MAANTKEGTTNIVLVHGGFVDGSGWEPVYNILKDDNYNVAIVIPPPAQQFMSKRAGLTVVEVAGSHVIYVSQPGAVASLIKKAAAQRSML